MNATKTAKAIKLHHGDNGVQEYWASEKPCLAILRCHGQKIWSVHDDGGLVMDLEETAAVRRQNGEPEWSEMARGTTVGMGGRTAQEAAERYFRQTGVRVVFCK